MLCNWMLIRLVDVPDKVLCKPCFSLLTVTFSNENLPHKNYYTHTRYPNVFNLIHSISVLIVYKMGHDHFGNLAHSRINLQI